MGLAGLFALVPLAVFGLWGGAWTDAMDRRIVLILASCGLAPASVLLWVQAALALNNVWVVMGLLSAQQAFYAVNQPTRSAAIPRMLPGEQLPSANSLNMTVFQFGAIVGPMLAGVLLRWVDLSTLYLLDAVCCAAPIWATVRLSPMPAAGDSEGSSGWGFAAVPEGFRYLAGNTVVLMSFVVEPIAMIFGMPRLAATDPSPGAGGGGGDCRLGCGHGGVRRGDWMRSWPGGTDALGGTGVSGRRRRRRHGLGGVPVDDPAAGGLRRIAWPAAGHIHRCGGGRTQRRRHLARGHRGGRRHHRGRSRGDACPDRRAGSTGVRPIPGLR